MYEFYWAAAANAIHPTLLFYPSFFVFKCAIDLIYLLFMCLSTYAFIHSFIYSFVQFAHSLIEHARAVFLNLSVTIQVDNLQVSVFFSLQPLYLYLQFLPVLCVCVCVCEEKQCAGSLSV